MSLIYPGTSVVNGSFNIECLLYCNYVTNLMILLITATPGLLFATATVTKPSSPFYI